MALLRVKQPALTRVTQLNGGPQYIMPNVIGPGRIGSVQMVELFGEPGGPIGGRVPNKTVDGAVWVPFGVLLSLVVDGGQCESTGPFSGASVDIGQAEQYIEWVPANADAQAVVSYTSDAAHYLVGHIGTDIVIKDVAATILTAPVGPFQPNGRYRILRDAAGITVILPDGQTVGVATVTQNGTGIGIWSDVVGALWNRLSGGAL